ncbi:hypothetical protein CAP35_01165 [Chitinophagaceae bacterium IBVUCB1]|nr:hypothetical protein CAP35_01165 [Chitinophagaceae bacterium IBVUCB1]
MLRDQSLREAIAADREEDNAADIFTDRVSIDKLRVIWDDKNRQYTDEELYQIREWLYVIAGAAVQVMENTPADTLEQMVATDNRKRIRKDVLQFTPSSSNDI